MAGENAKPERSKLPKAAARQRYVELAEVAVLRQIREDAAQLDDAMIAIGPFARLDAGTVAATEGKTRGAITNLFGSQAAFQAETMALALNVGALLEAVVFPEPADFDDAETWLDAFLAGQSARGPHHGAEPAADYAFLWALWLSAVPYGIWSAEISRSSLEEYVEWVRQLEQVLTRAMDRFGLRLRAGANLTDLACAMSSVIDGAWLIQCLTNRHPSHPSDPSERMLHSAGRLLWSGATEPSGRDDEVL